MTRLVTLIALFLASISAATIGAIAKEPGPDVDVVWSSSDGLKTEIFYAQRKDGVWLDPVQVSDDHYDNIYPVVDRDSSGRRWIFYTAHYNNTMELHYATGQNEDWQPGETLKTGRQTNLSPSLVVDKEDRVWVTWSANNGGLDDIMFAYYSDGSWSDPALVHEENEVADMLPVIDIDQSGAPFITWRVVKDGKNFIVLSRWENGKFSEPEVQQADAADSEESELDELELPPDVKNGSMMFVRMY